MRPAFSVVAERAVRYLDERPKPVSSRDVAREVLSTEIADESIATQVLTKAFAGDDRLRYGSDGWSLVAGGKRRGVVREEQPESEPVEADRVLVAVEAEPPIPRAPFALKSVALIRLAGERVVTACAGEVGQRRSDPDLRASAREALDGAIVVIHDAPGAIAALERWIEEPVGSVLSLRRLGQRRYGLPARHSVEALAARMGLPWRDGGDLIARAEMLETCLQMLRQPGETIEQLRAEASAGAPQVPWSQYAFDREFLRQIPATPGTYRFYDAAGEVLYVGKSSDLRRRVGSYFAEGERRSARDQRLIEALHRIEVEPSGSDLEALLREAAAIVKAQPKGNVQRRVHPKPGRVNRLRSILILEPAAPPFVLRAYLVRDGALVDRIPLGPRGGGLRRVERVLDTHFFDPRPGPDAAAPTPVDVDLIARWLAAHQDRVVAFDPTHHKTAAEVVARLRWFLEGGPLRDPDGAPIRYV